VLINSTWYDECLRHGDISHLLTSVVFEVKPPGAPALDMPTACSFYRGADDDSYTEGDRRKLALLLPHLSRALGVMSRLRMSDLKVAASLASLDQLPVALLLMSAAGEVLFCNRAATAMLASTDALSIDRSAKRHGQGRLTAKLPRTNGEIARALSNARRVDDVQHFSSLIEVPGNVGEGDWSIQLSRVTPGSPMTADGRVPEVIVFLNNLKQPLDLPPEVLCRTYGLTPAEARLAIAATAAGPLQDVARSIGVAPSTAKTHLKQVYAKTGAASRAELVRLVMGLATTR
jgi:DNA-binding CsgD family transcriptional regulator